MTIGKEKRIAGPDRGLENLLVFSTGALAAAAVRVRRQASFTTNFNRAIIAVVIGFLLLLTVLFWNAIRSTTASRKDQGPEAIDRPIAQSHSADAFGPRSLLHIPGGQERSYRTSD